LENSIAPAKRSPRFSARFETDPDSFMVLNNIGVVAREMGRLDESDAALTRVNQLAPEFVFGYYNRGHTLLLAGRVSESLAAYEEGWRRDTQKNRRQGCRLAVVRHLHGDVEEARKTFWESANHAPAEERHDLLLEAFEIIRTFTGHRSPSAAHAALLDEIADALRTQ
jgi:tetratricopeptide (TPR) repeat protein